MSSFIQINDENLLLNISAISQYTYDDSEMYIAVSTDAGLLWERKFNNLTDYEDFKDTLANAGSGGGGGGGTSDYRDLSNKPKINSVTLTGNKTSAELDLQSKLTNGENIPTINHIELIGSSVANIDLVPQLSVMPTPVLEYLGRIVQYTGSTNSTYTNGYFYKCTTSTNTFAWEQISVQPSDATAPDGSTITLTTGGQLKIVTPSDEQIEGKSSTGTAITTNKLDKAVMEGLGNNSLTWSDTYKTSAKSTLGIVDAVTRVWEDE